MTLAKFCSILIQIIARFPNPSLDFHHNNLNAMNPGRCAACRYLRRKCPPDCIFSPHFPPNVPQRFVSVHRIYGASNVAKLLQQLPSHLRAEAAESLCLEAQYRIEDPVYGCVGLVSSLQQQIQDTEKQLAKTRAEIAFLKSQTRHPQDNLLDNAANINFSDHQSFQG